MNDDIMNDDLKFKEQEKIINKTKEFLFILENQNELNKKKIESLNKQLEAKNKQIKELKKSNNNLLKENKTIKSTFSWKITKPLRWLKNLF